jgi:hypothetical protein
LFLAIMETLASGYAGDENDENPFSYSSGFHGFAAFCFQDGNLGMNGVELLAIRERQGVCCEQGRSYDIGGHNVGGLLGHL